ncbi:MAG TPA: twin-arginine translocase TatA/TatE family subunit [Kofleriaceae bacterium]|nr:twin-arginine translocase TatA/TatE family subunit [Kofleriaceae bacterium]
MFGLGMMELVVIAIVALLVVGPDKLPDAAKKISRGIRDFRKQTRELGKTLDDDTELGSAVRDLKSALRGDDFTRPPPRPPAPPVKADEPPLDTESPEPEPAPGDGAPIVKLAAGAVAKGDHAADDDEPHEDTTSGKAHG